MIRFLILGTLCALFLAACSDSNTSGPSQTEDIIPLAVGNTWIYQRFFYDSIGGKHFAWYDTIAIESSYVYNGETRYSLDYADWVRRHDSVFVLFFNTERLMIKYPMAIGESIVTDTSIIAREPSPEPIEEIVGSLALVSYESMTVEAGTFNCLKYQVEYVGLRTDSIYYRDIRYYSVNVGLISSEEYRLDLDSRKFELMNSDELIQYVLK